MRKFKIAREPIATWWEIESFSEKITPIEVVAFTEKTYTYLDVNVRNGKILSKYERRANRSITIHLTFDEAKKYAVERCKSDIAALESNLTNERENLLKWQFLEEPK